MLNNLSGQQRQPFVTGARKPSAERLSQISLSQTRSRTGEAFMRRLAAVQEEALAGSVNYISQLPVIKNQGERGACVAFALTGINEFFFQRKTGVSVDLSEQYLFFETKQFEGGNACSSLLSDAAGVVAGKGQCTEEIWSYNPNLPCIQISGKPANADSSALQFKNTYMSIPKSNDLIVQLKKTLVMGQLIAFTLPVYRSWKNDGVASTGRIPMPDNGEVPEMQDGAEDGHALMIVGYQDDPEEAGGGLFIVRNSWGPVWGANSFHGSGYGTIPYEFISRESWEVYAGPV
ncbi:MAG TPA: C1 family peptidase [Puia sp.]|jgi:C1A family cysteine protease